MTIARSARLFQTIYDSPWHNPAAFWASGVGFLAWWARRRAFLTAFVALFVVEILADALASGGWAPAALAGSPLAMPIAVLFVILGDFRYFLLITRFALRPGALPGDATSGPAWAAAGATSLLVPVASAVASRALPVGLVDPRWSYLVYETMLLVVVALLRFAWLPGRLQRAPPDVRVWLSKVTRFEAAQYALWALSDVLILRGVDAGFALRLIPNAMYYVLFLPFVVATAPRAVDA